MTAMCAFCARATGAVAAVGTLGILIPPSVIMVVYGIATETPIGELFAAGMIPGLLGILGYCLAIAWMVLRRPECAPPGEGAFWREVRAALGRVWVVLAPFAVVIGGIYAGLFTPTEAAGIGAACSLLIVAIRGDLTLRVLWEILVSTAEITASIFAILIGARVFAEFLNFSGAHEGLLALVRDVGLAPWAVIASILGCSVSPLQAGRAGVIAALRSASRRKLSSSFVRRRHPLGQGCRPLGPAAQG